MVVELCQRTLNETFDDNTCVEPPPPLFFFSLADSGSEASCHDMRNYRKKTDTVIDLRILTMFKKIYVIWKFSSSNFETRTATKRMMQPGLMCIHIK